MKYVKMKDWSVQYKDFDVFSTDSECEVWIGGTIQMKNDGIYHELIVKDVCRVDEDSDLFYIYTDEFECTKDVDASGKCNIILVDAKDKEMFNFVDNFFTSEEMKDKKIINGLRENPDFTMLLELASQREKEKVERQMKKSGWAYDSSPSQQASGVIFSNPFPQQVPGDILGRVTMTFDDFTPEKLLQRKQMKENQKGGPDIFCGFSMLQN